MEDPRFTNEPSEDPSQTSAEDSKQMFSDSEFQEIGEKQDSATNDPYAFQAAMTDLSKPKTHAFSIVSMVLGIISVICCCFGWSSLLLGAAAIVFVILSRRHLGYFDGMTIAGLVLGIVGCVLGLAFIVLTPVFELAFEETMKEFGNAFDEGAPDVNTQF